MTPSDVNDAICKRLATLWTERTIYSDECPDDHKRPSAFVQIVEDPLEPVNIGLVRWRAKFLVVVWGDVDDYALADSEELTGDQIDVISVLTREALPVGDRHVTLTAKGKGRDPDDGAAFVEADATWIDTPPVPRNAGSIDPNRPMMEDFIGRINNNEVEVRSDKSG